MQLSEDQEEQWRSDGFTVIPRLVDRHVVAQLRRAYDDIIGLTVNAAGDRMLGGITRQVMGPSTAHPAFAENGVLAAAREAAAQLLQTSISFHFDMLIYKPPGHTYETPWHQDCAYGAMPVLPPGTAVSVSSIQFWVPLDDVDDENGCMHFIPRPHGGPSLEHYVAAGDQADPGRLLALVDPAAQLDLSSAVPVPLPAGGATLHGPATPHYTGPNRSADRPRRAYIFNLGI